MRLEEICTVFTDGDWIESKDQSDDGIRLVQTGNIGEGIYLEKEARAKYISEETFGKLKCTEIFPGDILVSRLPDPVGRACIIPEKEERMITAVDCTICRPNESIISKEYLCYFMRSSAYYKRLLGSVTGTTRKRISRKNLGNVELEVPSKEIQMDVVEQLDCLVKVIESRKQELQLLDNLIKARFVEMFGLPGTDEKGWGLRSLGECCELNPKKGSDRRLTSGIEVSFIPMTAVSENGAIKTSEKKTYDEVKVGFTYFAENDVLFAKITPCMENGKGAVAVDLCNGIGFGSTEFHVLRPLAGRSNPYWLYSLTVFDTFRKDATANMTGSAGQRRVPSIFLDKYKVTLPLELQNQFADFVHQVDKSKVAVQKALDETQLLFNSLMQKYFG